MFPAIWRACATAWKTHHREASRIEVARSSEGYTFTERQQKLR